MEDEKRKKKNKKKKKNKQQAKSAAGDVDGNTSSQEQSIVNLCDGSGDNVGDRNENMKVGDEGRASAEVINGSHSADDGKQSWLQEEARLRDMVKQLLYEKDSYIQKQADLEKKVTQLQGENDSWRQKEADLEMKVTQLQGENDVWRQKEAHLEMKVTQLQGENDSWRQKEVILEQRISQLLQEQASLNFEKRDLQEKIGHIEKEKALLGEKKNLSKEMIAALDIENISLRMKVGELEGARSIILEENRQLSDSISMLRSRIQDLEMSLASAQSSVDAQKVILEQRISQLLQEQASLNLEKRVLEEKIGHTEKEKALLCENEKSSKEALDNENSSLRMKVGELEGARSIILEEKRLLLDNISMLESQIQDLETSLASAQKEASEKEELNAQIEVACALIEKLVTENAELVEKMSEFYMDLGPRNVGTEGGVSVVMPESYTVEDYTSSGPAKAVELSEQQQYSVEMEQASNVVQHSSESGEIVQIPLLDENETHRQDLEAQPPGEEDAVPITDAPLTGAPFRLVSFVASFMSGADLVNKSSSDTLQ